MSDRIAVMDSGVIAQEGSPQEIYGNPVNEFVASFIGSTNLFVGTLNGPSTTDPERVRITTEFGTLETDANPAIKTGDQVIVAIRPEDVVLHRDAGVAPTLPNRFEAKVGIGLFTGNSVEYYVDVDRTLIQARSPSRHPLKRGDSVHIELPADAIKTFVLEGEPKVRIGSRRLATLARVDDDGDG
jgi:iron(III) transport system ATP-binding protein